MAGRIRSIKPEWLEDERLSEASKAARLLSVGLILLADDHGNGRASTKYLMQRVSLDSLEEAEDALSELVAIEYVRVYSNAGQRYYSIRNWRKHQRVDHPGAGLVPGPDGAVAPSSRAAASPKSLEPSGDRPGVEDPTHNPVTIELSGEDPGVNGSVATVSRHTQDGVVPDQDQDQDQDQDRDQEKDQDALAREAALAGSVHGGQGQGAEGEPRGPVIRELFATYLDGWKVHAAEGEEEPTLTDARRRRFRERLKEHSATTLAAALVGIWHSKWNVEHGVTGIDVVLKDAGAVEQFAALARRQQPKVKPAKRRLPSQPPPPLSSGEVLDPAMSGAAARQALSAMFAGAGNGGRS